MPALTELERQVIAAAVLWVTDQDCSLALACLEEAVADYLAATAAARKLLSPKETSDDPSQSSP